MDIEDIKKIAREVASQFTGMRCACKNLHPIFLSAIEGDLRRWGAPGSPESQELQASLAALAKDCGYERDKEGTWVQFPGQEKALQDLGTDYEVIEEHDDGDLTIRIPAHNTKAVVTTEGEIFTKPNNPGTRYQEEGEEPIVSETEAFEKRLEYELKKSGFTAEPGEGNPTTVQCPICHKVIDIPQYDEISRSDALIKHVKKEHTGWIAKLKEGNPGAPVLYEARLWRKWANMDDVIQPFATEQEAYDYLTHLKYIAKAGDKITVKRSQEWDIKVLHRETIEKDGQYWAIRKPYEPIPTEPKGGNPEAKYLPCPICLDGKQKPRFIEEGLRYHLGEFHKRIDVDELVKLSKEMAGEGNPVEYVTITDPGKTTLASRR